MYELSYVGKETEVRGIPHSQFRGAQHANLKFCGLEKANDNGVFTAPCQGLDMHVLVLVA
jgi:hypothetical protein